MSRFLMHCPPDAADAKHMASFVLLLSITIRLFSRCCHGFLQFYHPAVPDLGSVRDIRPFLVALLDVVAR